MNAIEEWQTQCRKWNSRQMLLHNPLSDREWREMRHFTKMTRSWKGLTRRKQNKVISRLRRSARSTVLRLRGDHAKWMWRARSIDLDPASPKRPLMTVVGSSAPLGVGMAIMAAVARPRSP